MNEIPTFFSLLIVIALFVQCEVLDVDRDKTFVRAEIVENKLIIQNYNLFPIYLVAMDVEFASRIDWFPVESEENKVPAIRKRILLPNLLKVLNLIIRL